MDRQIYRHNFVFAGLFALGLFVAGCSLLGGLTTKVASGVDKYCQEPLAERQLVRQEINAALAAHGHTIIVTCAGDPPATPASNP